VNDPLDMVRPYFSGYSIVKCGNIHAAETGPKFSLQALPFKEIYAQV
jgi:hypothetical protein